MKRELSKYILPLLIIFSVGAVLFLQFDNWSEYRMGIEESNYYLLLLSSVAIGLVALPLSLKKEAKIGVSDIVVWVFAIYVVINSYLHNAVGSEEFRMSVAYFTLYISCRLMFDRYPKTKDYIVVVVLIAGIYQSVLIVKQIYGLEYSNHSLFAATGSFYNPGPCGIFICAILALAIYITKNSTVEIKKGVDLREYLTIETLLYVVALLTVVTSLVVVVPTMSRAGCMGLLVALVLIYRGEIDTLLDSISKKNKISRRGLYAISATLILLLLVLVYFVKKGSADGRLFIWRNVIDAFVDSPIFGVGVDGFARSYSASQSKYFVQSMALTHYNPNIDVVGVPNSVFNELLAISLLLGATGLIFVGYILFVKFRDGIKRGNAMVFMAISIFVASLFSYTFYIPINSILFVIAMASITERKEIKLPSKLAIFIIFVVICGNVYINRNFRNEIKAHREWKECAMFYSMKDYETCVDEYGELLPYFENNHKFMFEYGHSLNKIGKFEESNEILQRGAKHSTDPMFLTIIGNNYAELNMVDKSEQSYLNSYYLCPNRLYPIFQLIKLYNGLGDKEKTRYYIEIFRNKKAKVETNATEDMRNEVEEIIDNIDK